MNRYTDTSIGEYSPNVEESAAGSPTDKRKYESLQSQEPTGKRKRSEVGESFPSWQSAANLQTVNAMMPSSLYQPPMAVNPVLQPTPIPAVNFLQQPTPTLAALPGGFPQNIMPNMTDPSSNTFQMAFYQQCLLASQMQQQQYLLQLQQQRQAQLQQQQQAQLQQQQQAQLQQQQQAQLQQQQQAQLQHQYKQRKSRNQPRQQHQYQQNQEQQLQQYQQSQLQQYQQNQPQNEQIEPNQSQQPQSQQNEQEQLQHQQNEQQQLQYQQNEQQQKQNQSTEPQEQQSRKNEQQQQPSTGNYFNPQFQHTAASPVPTDASQSATTTPSATVSTPRRGKKRASSVLSEPSTSNDSTQVVEDRLKQIMRNVLHEQQINLSPSLQISVGTSQNTAQTLQNPAVSSLQNPDFQNPASARIKSRSDSSSSLRSAPSPIASSSSTLNRVHSPLCRVQSPLSGLLTPPPSSTPNPFWQLQEEMQHQQNEQQHQYQQRQFDQEIISDSAYQSQDSQSSLAPSTQEILRPRDRLENVDGYKSDDFDVEEQALDLTVRNAPPSIMNPLNIKGKKLKKQVNDLAVCDNLVPKDDPIDLPNDLISGGVETAGVSMTEPVDDLPNWLKNDSEQIAEAEETVDNPRVKEFWNESNSLDHDKTHRTHSSVLRDISLENNMKPHPVGGSKRGKRKGKNNGRRAIKKKHAKKMVTVKNKCVKLESADIEIVKEALQPIKKKHDISQSLKVECPMQTIVAAENEKKRKRTQDLDPTENVLKSRFQPNQMVSLNNNWQYLFEGETWINHLLRRSESKTT